ncbi:MAG: PHP domain-containing protein [Mycoplasma sp.]
MKIDLHLHTSASESNGDSIKFISAYDSLCTINNAGVKMAAFTDHNTFDKNIYLEARAIAKTGGIVMLPGIEVNVVKQNGEIAHMLILFKEDLNESQLDKICTIAKTKIWKSGVSITSINELFSEFETIRIIHIGKSEFFQYMDLEGLNYDAFEVTNLNHPNYKSVSRHGCVSSLVSFSDTHMWNNYPQIKEYETFINDLKVASFDNLKHSLSLNKNYIRNRRNND